MKKLVAIFLLMLVAVSCRTEKTRYVPIESTHVSVELDSLNRLVRQLMEHSTSTKESEKVSIKETNTYTVNEKGDTVKIIIEKEKDTSKEILKLEQYYLAIIDSLANTKVRVDSIDRPVPYPVTEYVEVNVLRWWQKVLMWIGGAFLVGGLSAVTWKVAKMRFKLK